MVYIFLGMKLNHIEIGEIEKATSGKMIVLDPSSIQMNPEFALVHQLATTESNKKMVCRGETFVLVIDSRCSKCRSELVLAGSLSKHSVFVFDVAPPANGDDTLLSVLMLIQLNNVYNWFVEDPFWVKLEDGVVTGCDYYFDKL